MSGILQRMQLLVEFIKTLRRAHIDPIAAMMFSAGFAQCDLLAQQWGERRFGSPQDLRKK
jgi:hypothetical protein